MSSEEELSHDEVEESEEEAGSEEEVEEEQVAVAKKKRKTKGKKKNKDPDKPKKNMTAYFLYCNANRARVKQENPEASFGDLTKLVSAEYKQLSAKEKAKWDKKAAADKARYDREMANYVAPEMSSDEEGGGGKKKKKKKDPNAPKRNMTAYFLYSTANRDYFKQQNPDASFGDLARIISANYKAMSDKERKKWEKKAAEDKERYQREMAAYNG